MVSVEKEIHEEYTLTCPAKFPLPSFRGAPTATIFPFEDIDTDLPDISSGASPSISDPSFIQVPFSILYILTCPDCVPLASFCGAPIATVFPSDDKDTDQAWSSEASPSISDPT